MRYFRIVAALVLVLSGISPQPTAALYLSLDFAFDHQTYSWADSLLISRRLDRATTLQVKNRSTATLIKKSVFGKGEDRWQKLARSVAMVTRRLGEKVSAGVELNQDFERLEKRRFIGNRALLFGTIDLQGIKVVQKGGVVWEERQTGSEENVQSGFGHRSEITLSCRDRRKLGRIVVSSDLNTLRRTPRKSISFAYDLTRTFTGCDTTTLHLSQSFGERKYFLSRDDFDATAQQRSEQRRFDFDLRRRLPAEVYLTARAGYRFSSYRYNYDDIPDELIQQRDNLNSLFEYQFRFSRRFGRKLFVAAQYLYSRTKEDFGTQQMNQKSEMGELSLRATWALFTADTIQVSGKVGVTSYFAPTTSAYFSDRDRTIEVASFRLAHRFTRFLKGGINGSFRGFHTIYVSGSLSANNNINNIFVLNPGLVWQPCDNVIVTQNYQMHANYIYYDYEKGSLTGRNTIYRRANFINRLTWTLSPNTDLNIDYSYRYEDFGRIHYTDQWQQQVSWDRRTHRPRFGLDYHPTASFRFQPYVVYEIQRSYDHLPDPNDTLSLGLREQSEEFVRTLVGFELQVALSAASYIECKLERRVQEYQYQRRQEYDLFTITVKKYL